MPYDLFISYAHRDNARGQVRELRDAIAQDFHKFAGRNIQVFFDEHDIQSMADWEKCIAQGLRESRLFLAVLSPNYFSSAYCRREWEEYVRYEAMRQCLGEGVAPVYFIELPGLDGPGVEQSIAVAVDEMRKRQWCDLASPKPVKIVPWHDAGKRALEDVEVARRLKALKEQMAERLKRADRAQQSPTNLYRHNPQFVGRVRELTLLREALNERGSVGVVGHKTQSAGATAVHGLGGMGKTELALAYAHAFAWDYPGGRWLARCEGLDNFDLVLRQLAEPLHVEFTEDEKKDAHRAGERILTELRRRERSLLLLDNVTHPELLGPDVLMRLPPQGHVHLLATTRLGPAQLAGSPHDHTFVAVDELPPDDALALIRAHQPDARFASGDDESAARELVKLLAGFTLAVETAAIYLGRHAATDAITTYTERLRRELLAESESSAADQTVAVRHKEKLLERTLAMTFETLSAEQLHVLTLSALLPPDQVPLPWLRSVASEKFPTLKPDSKPATDGATQQLTDSLLSLRLVQLGRDVCVVRMHRMVQEVLKKLARLSVPQLESRLVTHINSRAEFLCDGWIHQEHRWELEPITACAWQWMERGSQVGTYLANQTAAPLRWLAHFAEGERLARRALAIDENTLGSNHLNVAADLSNLAHFLHATNRLNEAEMLARRALAITEKALGQEDPKFAMQLNNLAGVLNTTNRLKEAETFIRRALAIFERSCGSDHANVAISLNTLAELLMTTNRVREAESLLRRALSINERCFGSNHPDVASTLNNLAQILQADNRAAEAEPLMQRALAIDERNYGPDHPEVGARISNLAVLLYARNRLSEAEPLMRRALAIDEKTFGPNDPKVAVGLNNLGALLRATKRFLEAEPLNRRALTIDENNCGSDHPNVARDLNNVATLLIEMNRLAETEPLMRRALEIFFKFSSTVGNPHPGLLTALTNYLELLGKMGHAPEEMVAQIRTLANYDQAMVLRAKERSEN